MTDRTGVALIGAGRWGSNLLRVFRNNPRADVRWVVDLDPGRLDGVAARNPGLQVTDDYARALDDPQVAGVVIATPGPTHHAMAMAAFRAGKHVFVEKPLATDVDNARELCRVAEAQNLVLMVGHVFVYNPAVQHVRHLISSGQLGGIFHISSLRTNLGPFLDQMNAAWDLACHDVSIANYWLGSQPIGVRATGGSWVHQPIEEVVFAMLRYPGDVLVSIHVSWVSPLKRRETTVVGDRAMLIFDDVNLTEPIRIFNTGIPPVRSDETPDSYVSFRSSVRDGDIIIPRLDHHEPLMAESDAYIDAIRTGAPTLSDGTQGLEVVEVLSAISQSLEQMGREVPVGQNAEAREGAADDGLARTAIPARIG